MIKFRLYYDKDKDEEWINEMAAKGWALTGFFAGFYKFEKCEPGEYIYQVDFTDGLFRIKKDYREFMAEMGAEIVSIWGFWVYLRKKASEGAFELYTDVESNIAHYTKIRNMFKAVTCIELVAFFIEVFLALIHEEGAGKVVPKICACVLIVIVLVFIRQIARLTVMITELKARIGEAEPAREQGRGKLSLLFSVGLIINAAGIILNGRYSDIAIVGYIGDILILIAFVFIIIGLWRTVRGKTGKPDKD